MNTGMNGLVNEYSLWGRVFQTTHHYQHTICSIGRHHLSRHRRNMSCASFWLRTSQACIRSLNISNLQLTRLWFLRFGSQNAYNSLQPIGGERVEISCRRVGGSWSAHILSRIRTKPHGPIIRGSSEIVHRHTDTLRNQARRHLK